ncbi:O-antigen ligase family protein [Patescibacteria group bacterium]|nr:O-antigen ligase family protein [Patescibacteria group bacterium]MBU1472608.1 O-antigen ligase family protein [Patescibacteria group bacterium]MBU2459859.1 O-antigen ligase family protein [Patescibacteria group bacterium]MBU2544080.1 O-antigen ligase family protein [Patescibacteria group bacterium]
MNRISHIADRIIRTSFLLLVFIIPLLFTPWNYELFEFNKMIAVYALTAVIAAAWLVKSIAQGELKIAKTPLDIPLALFVCSQLLSSLFSIDPHVSWFGYYSRFNGGMWSVITYVTLFYAFVTNFSIFSNQSSRTHELGIMNHELGKKNKKNLASPPFTIHHSLFTILKVILAAASIVALYGVAERLGIDKHLWVQDVQNRVFSTLGQPNWLAAYLVALLPLSFAVMLPMTNDKWPMLNTKKIKGLLFIIYHLSFSILFFLVLLFTRSRSGLAGFLIADLVFWGLVFALRPGLKEFQGLALIKPAAILHLVFAIIVFVNGTGTPSLDKYITFSGWKNLARSAATSRQSSEKAEATPSAVAGPALEVGGTESGTIRKYVWQGAINAWKGSPKALLIGTGTETFAWAFFQYRPREHNLTSEWDFLYNKAHNEYLNYLATTGILGLGSYLLFIWTFIVWFAKKVHGSKSNDLSMNYELIPINLALFAGWVSILVTNFFGFSVVVTQVFLFLFPAIIIASILQSTRASKDNPAYVFKLSYHHEKATKLAVFAVFIALAGILLLLAKWWYADTLYATGHRLSQANMYEKAEALLTGAIAQHPSEPLYYDELGTVRASLAARAWDMQNATKAATLAKQSLEESDTALRTSPHNVNFWKTRTKIYYTLATLDPHLGDAAVEALMRARELSPNDPKILYNLAILYGRLEDNDRAIALLTEAVDLKPNYRDAYWALSLFYNETKQPDKAKTILSDYLSVVDPNDIEFKTKLSQ